jgi:hypothetical protein
MRRLYKVQRMVSGFALLTFRTLTDILLIGVLTYSATAELNTGCAHSAEKCGVWHDGCSYTISLSRNKPNRKTKEPAMTLSEFQPTQSPTPSRSRMRYVQAHLQADADAVLREIAYVLKLTQQVKQQILCEEPEPETAGV